MLQGEREVHRPINVSDGCNESDRSHHSGDTDSPAAAKHLEAGLPPGTLEVVDHLPKVHDPGSTDGMTQGNSPAGRVNPEIKLKEIIKGH
ncbi:MAG: hypothetical protein A2Y79_11150 [Deltaproteobacteria bacterium RBG_13_43_22]|nr:MAG: hypothetical protein A2Y79_11150 [Deltaproteobacteria bacterium RBG_13_43_22]